MAENLGMIRSSTSGNLVKFCNLVDSLRESLLSVYNSMALILSHNENILVPLIAEIGEFCSRTLSMFLGDVMRDNMRELNDIIEHRDECARNYMNEVLGGYERGL